MADFRINVSAETQQAEQKLRAVDKAASDATKARTIKIDTSFVENTTKQFKGIQASIKDAANNVQTFYRISKNIPGIGDRVREVEALAKGTVGLAQSAPQAAAALRENAKAGTILSNSFETAGGAVGRLINNLAKTGFAIFAVKEAVSLLQGAFGGFFNETIGREIKLRETILKTQTTLASTNKVFRNGKEITDPYEKIVALTGEVAKRIDSIRERSIALAGVTSGDVIEVFGIVASQVGQIGGGLKDAEDLAINFAAALGTFGIPLYQARQEIGSILRGDITTDSYLAKALGITNEDVAKAKTQAGGVIKFLEERLAASVAGQRIAAQGFAGVVSNIRDLGELISQRFGAGLLDPMLGGLTKVFDFLFKIREEVFAISEGIGRGLGSLLSTNLSIIGGGSALFGQAGAGAEDFAAQLAKSVKKAFASLQSDASSFIAPLRNIFEELSKSLGLLIQGLAKLAQGFISIKIENFKALVQIFSNLSEAVTIFSAALSGILTQYGRLLQLPLVQYLSGLSVQFQLLERLGVMSAVKLGFAAVSLIAAWKPIVAFFQALIARIAALIGGLVIAVGAALSRIGALIAAFAATITAANPALASLQQQLVGLGAAFTSAGVSADKAGVSVARFGGATTAAARTVGTAILGFLKMSAVLLLVQAGITILVDAFGRFQRAAEDQKSTQRAEVALQRLRTTYKDVSESADSATKAARDYEQAIVNAQYTKNLDQLEQIREKINQINYELKPGIQSWGEFWAALSGEEAGRFAERSRQILQGLKGEEQKLKSQLSQVDRDRDKQRVEENIRLEAEKRVDLAKEIGEIERQQQSQLFQLRQQQAQKEVEIFRLAGELRIFQMEQANAKLIEGEEGASRTALEALSNYLSTRERGELEIEASKKELVIESANLERQIADYRLENEKKIAEIRKRAGDYEQKVADYRRTLAGQTPVAGATGLYQGNTGTSTSGPHFHVAGALSEAEARSLFAPEIRAQLILTDVPGSARSGGRTHQGYDLAGPKNTPLNLAPGFSLQNFTSDPNGLGGNYATIAGANGKTYKVMHLANPGANYRGPNSAVAPPTAPSFADVGAPAVDKYAEAVRSLAGAMERVRALQAALTQAKTAAAFDQIAKAMFPKVELEQYKDKITETEYAIQALGAVSAEAYDPDQIALSAEYNGALNQKARELSQLLGVAAKQLKPEEFYKLWEQLKVSNAKFKQDLAEQNRLKEEQLRLDKARNALQEGLNRLRSTKESTSDSQLRTRLTLEGMSPEQIEGALQKAQIARSYQDALANPATKETALKQIEQEFAAVDALVAARTAENDPVVQLVSKWKRELGDTQSMITSLAQTIQSELASAMSNAIMGVIDGTMTVQEAFANMFKNIAKAFLDMATQMISKWLVMKALGLIFPGLQFTLPGLASGGPVAGGSPYIVGERGPELFVPNSSGRIVPNHELGGGTGSSVNVVVNVDASGRSNVQGNDQMGNQLGRLVAAAVQQELVKQKRPGGVLA